ncbi:MAG: hypothetical protein CMK09_04690 [Ponticaulis sp.]|nr:hypothetical protein [Ponticaulis sp.]|tara:strand:- start:61 stop:465 length:405 start_codon:yes stop_codon:yes gene_type:complete
MRTLTSLIALPAMLLITSACGAPGNSESNALETISEATEDISGYYFCMMRDFENQKWFFSKPVGTDLGMMDVALSDNFRLAFEDTVRSAHSVSADANHPSCHYKFTADEIEAEYERFAGNKEPDETIVMISYKP